MDGDALEDDGLSSWSLVEATPKKKSRPASLPLPVCLQIASQPRMAAPFQVSETQRVQPRFNGDGPNLALPSGSGLARPAMIRDSAASHAGSVDQLWTSSPGLASPCLQIHPPRSLTFHAPVSNEVGWYEPASARPQTDRPMDLEGIGTMPNERSFKSNPGSNLTRVQLAAKSPVVLTVWGQCVKLLLPVSNALQQMDMSLNCEEHHHRFLNQFAATTLVKYLTALLRFVHMCEEMRVELHDLSDVSMADILITGSMARRSVGSGPRHSVTIKALRWACKQLEIRCFESAFSSLVASFEKQKLPYDRKEALPLPLFTLIQWGRRILSSASSLQEVVILGGLLLLAWSGLRFSDLQRSYLDSWRLDSTSLRGLCWRSKTCNQSTPFGIKLAGFLSVGAFTWVHRYLMVLDQMYALELSQSIDFAIPSFGGGAEPMYPFTAMPYGEALYFLRTLLQLPWRTKTCEPIPSGMSYSIHGLKATMLSWAAQAQVDEADRRMHGKHKAQSQSVQLYSRDDILCSLRLQQTLIQKVQSGWRPQTPLARGGQTPVPEVQFALEKFSKALPPMVWKFFRFDICTDPSLDVGGSMTEAKRSEEGGSSSSDSDSYSESEDSASEVESPPKVEKTKTAGKPAVNDTADEGCFGLHRNMWHVMIVATSSVGNLPSAEGHSLKTACGRHLVDTKVAVAFELQLESGQTMCSHGGCRKAFQSLEAIGH